TFHIKRENAPADAPLENLVLSPLSDGTYRELLVIYHLTLQEKQQIENEHLVDLTGKTTTQELVPGTYGSGLMNKTTTTQCYWETATVNVPCLCEGHTLGQECTCTKGKPKQYVLTWNVCEEVEDTAPSGGSTDPGNTGGGGDSETGSTNPSQPCDGGGALTEPQDPSTTLGTQDGCNTGIPTLPNLPPKNNPCEKVKKIVNNPELKIKIDSLKQFSLTAEEDEKGYHQDKSGNVTPATVNGAHYVKFTIDQNSLGGIHCHTLNGPHMFSPKDILTFLSFARMQNYTLPVGSTADNTGNAFLGMIAQSGSYFITFNGGSGDLPPPMTQAEEDAYEAKLKKEYKKIIIKLLKAEGKSDGDDLSQTGLHKLFFAIVKEMGLEGKINLIKEDGGSTSTIQQNTDGTIKEPIPC
ncbi:hypothetical protein, partial [uncultured Chryseobacterium sp.]|uniref:hypothetical protein n=1 Tax=uncultured Chryseobacterium sp. TaxID=259322 RepID=UPI0026229AED